MLQELLETWSGAGAATEVIVVVVAREEGAFINLEEVTMVVGSLSPPVSGDAVAATYGQQGQCKLQISMFSASR